MITGIAHAAYRVKDMERALAFYCDVLGMERAFSLADDAGQPWIEYLKAAPGQFIELFYAAPDQSCAFSAQDSYAHLCLQVDDIQAIARQITQAGGPLTSAPSQGKDHNWQCWTVDPDGNPIELMQISPESPQARHR